MKFQKIQIEKKERRERSGRKNVRAKKKKNMRI